MKFVIRGSSLLEKHPSQLTESVSRGDNFFWVALDFGWFWNHCTHHFFRRPLLGQRRPTTNTYLFLGCLCSGQEAQETHLKFTSYFHQIPILCHIWYANSGVCSCCYDQISWKQIVVLPFSSLVHRRLRKEQELFELFKTFRDFTKIAIKKVTKSGNLL